MNNKEVTCPKAQQAYPLTQLSDFAYNLGESHPKQISSLQPGDRRSAFRRRECIGAASLQYTGCSYSASGAGNWAMSDVNGGIAASKSDALSQWHLILRDESALLARPGAHHKALLKLAHVLHQSQVIDRDHLSDLLELADGALAYAVEAMLDLENDK